MRWAVPAAVVALVASGAQAAPGDMLQVVGDVVNMRSRPAATAPIRIQVYRGQEATEIRREDEWVELELVDTGMRGWIHGSLLEPAAAPAPAPPAAEAVPPPARAVPAVRPAPVTPAPEPEPEPEPEPAAGPEPVEEVEAAAPPPAAPPQPEELDEEEPLMAALPPQVEPQAAPPGADPAAIARFEDSVSYLNQRAMSVAGIDLFTDVRPVDAGTVQVVATDIWRSVPESGQESYLATLFDRWLAAAGSQRPLRLEVVDEAGQVLSAREGP